MALTKDKIQAGELDLLTLAAVANGSAALNGNGTYTGRKGAILRTLARVLADMAATNPRGAWASGVQYKAKDIVTSGGLAYIAVTDYTSAASIDADVEAGNAAVYQGDFNVRSDLGNPENEIAAFRANSNKAITRRLRDKAREVVSVSDFGALLDTYTPEASAANAEALADAAATGKRVYVPRGRLYLDTQVTLPERFYIFGDGPQHSTFYFGPNGQLNMQGPAYNQTIGDAAFRDIGFAYDGDTISRAAIQFVSVSHITWDRCLFYHIQILLDNHHHMTFLTCRFFGSALDPNMRLVSKCDVQPSTGGFQNISDNIKFIDCFGSGFPMELIDTVEPCWLNTQLFGGAFAIYSRRSKAQGDMPISPFYMGPVLIGCTLDATRGIALDVDYGGTNCRVVGCFISGGRVRDDALDPNNTFGIRFTNTTGVEIANNHFEWSGSDHMRLANCWDMNIIGNNFINPAQGDGINLTGCGRIKIIGNSFLQRPLFGGSQVGVNGNKGMKFGIETPASDLVDSVIIGNTFSGMSDPNVIYIEGPGTIVEKNPGVPILKVRPLMYGPQIDRNNLPSYELYNGRYFYNATTGAPNYYDAPASRWIAPAMGPA